jgi:transcriptional regulator
LVLPVIEPPKPAGKKISLAEKFRIKKLEKQGLSQDKINDTIKTTDS